jgi:uncharacterized protein YodC (DUF2158 family)
LAALAASFRYDRIPFVDSVARYFCNAFCKEERMTFKVGCLVQLNGGSQIMSVISLGKDRDGEPLVICTWFENGKQQSAGFSPEALKTYSVGEGPY